MFSFLFTYCSNSSPEHELMATHWIKWLSKEEAHYEAASGVHASFGEILLLIAIHFHASQVEAIADLVCSVLGMNIRLGSLTRMKTLFTQEIFPEKVCHFIIFFLIMAFLQIVMASLNSLVPILGYSQLLGTWQQKLHRRIVYESGVSKLKQCTDYQCY